MPLAKEQLEGLDVLLNEAVVLDAELDPERRLLGLTFYVEMVPERGERNVADLYLQLLLQPVSRLAISLRHGFGWTDPDAHVEELGVEDLSRAVRSIQYHDSVFGWRFIDVPEEEAFDDWRDRLSLDFRSGDDVGQSHTLTVWNEELVIGRADGRRVLLDLRVWFDDLSIRDCRGEPIQIEAAVAASRRYWHKVFTRGSGGPSPYPVPHLWIPLPASGKTPVPAR